MAYAARRVEYFYTTVTGASNEAYELLTHLADLGVNLVAMNSMPLGPESVQLTLFPEDTLKLQSAARNGNLRLDGPHTAVLVQGDDEVGAIARLHHRLGAARVNVYATSGVTDDKGMFGYILFMRPEDADRAVQALRE